MYKTTVDCSGDTKVAANLANRLFRDNGLSVSHSSIISEPGKLVVQSFKQPPSDWLVANLRVFA